MPPVVVLVVENLRRTQRLGERRVLTTIRSRPKNSLVQSFTIRSLVPKIFYITEKAWNYYPFTITEYTCSFVPRFAIHMRPRPIHMRRLNWAANLNGIWFIGWLKAAMVMENPEKDSAMKPWSWKTVK